MTSASVPVETNCFPIDFSEGKLHNYARSYEFLGRRKGMAGQIRRIDAQHELVRVIHAKHLTESGTRTSVQVEGLCVYTGHTILSAKRLDIGDGFFIECTRK